jgi:uncharacterized membrane protein HdeD (DUF308 family)
MNLDKLFYATWGFVFILAGISAIFGIYLKLDLFSTIMIWLISVGIMLVIAGLLNMKEAKRNGILQMVLGFLFVVISASVLTVVLEIINILLSIAIIIILIGIIIIAMSLSKSGDINDRS